MRYVGPTHALLSLAGIVLSGVALALLTLHEAPVAATAGTIARTIGPDDADLVEIVRTNAPVCRLTRVIPGDWRLVAPYRAETDAAAVARLLDALLLMRPGDRLDEGDLRALRRTPRDFGLGAPALSVTVGAYRRRVRFDFGGRTAAGDEVYVRVNGAGPILAVPAAAFDAVPADIARFRRRRIFSATPGRVTAADFRVPGSPFVRVSREQGAWRIVQPAEAPAEAEAVEAALADLLALSAGRFVRTLSDVRDIDPETGRARAASLAPWGLGGDETFAVTLWTSPVDGERIVFGAPAGTNAVYALANDGMTVVTVDRAAVENCRACRARFLDARIFPFGAAALASVSVTLGDTAYALVRDGSVWKLSSPVAAPADPSATSELIARVMALKQNDRRAHGAGAATVTVRVDAPAATSLTAVVSRDILPAPADLRAKRVLAVTPGAVRRLTVATAGRAVSVARTADRTAWRVERGADARADGVCASTGGVARVLAVLARVDATSVENLNAAPEHFRQAGLAKPAFVITADVDGGDSFRKTLLLGNAAPGGGRYATAGGADAIFIVSRKTVADLTVPLVESETANTSEREEQTE